MNRNTPTTKYRGMSTPGHTTSNSTWIIRDCWRIEKVKEAVVFHSLGDCSDGSLRLVLLLLLNGLDGHVLARLPVDGAAFALKDLCKANRRGLIYL